MGNAIMTASGAGGGGRKAKIMKMNGEFFKLGTPAKVGDIIDSYPGHVLLDSDEFLRFNLRARPLDPEFELQPKQIYLLVELPRFPTAEEADNTPRRTNSVGILDETCQPPENVRTSHRSVSDLSITARLEADDGGESGGEGPSTAAVRVKLKLPKAQVERILQQSSDDAEAAEKIIDLCMDNDGRAVEEGDSAVALDAEPVPAEEQSARNNRWTEITEDKTTEKVSFSNYCVNLNPILRFPNSDHHSKYKKLTNDYM